MRDWMETAVSRAKEVDWTKAASRKPRHQNMSAMQVLMRCCNTRQEVNVTNETVTIGGSCTDDTKMWMTREYTGINELNLESSQRAHTHSNAR